MNVTDVKQVKFTSFSDGEANLSVYESSREVPFDIKRVFCISSHKVSQRGNHAHKKCFQLLVCLSGKVHVFCKDKIKQVDFEITEPSTGIIIPPMIWSYQVYKEPGSILMVLCSDLYDESDYIRDYEDFMDN